jgi:sterol 3beta-glucosyltransferase
MQITILTVGSRGDVQPYIALGLGLQAAGHAVCLATESQYRDWVVSHGLAFAALPGNTLEKHATAAWKTLMDPVKQTGFLHDTLVCFRQFVQPTLRQQLDATWTVCQGAEAIISMPSVFASYHVAEKLAVPFYNVWTCPVTPTRHFSNSWYRLPRRMNRWLGGTLNWISYNLPIWLFWFELGQEIDRWRQEVLQLPSMTVDSQRMADAPWLYAYSPSVLPKPEDWAEQIHVTGYWFLDQPQDWHPSPRLVDFLQAGDAPVYVGFGSLPTRDPRQATQLVVEAIARTGQRAILDQGWGGLEELDLPDSIYVMQSHEGIHEWLLPQVSAVVHHGGNGTTAAGLLAGKPTVVVHPAMTDCGFWGQQMAALGVGPEPILRSQLTVDRLAAAIQTAVTDPSMRLKAKALGDRIRSETGVQTAVAAFHQHLPSSLSSLSSTHDAHRALLQRFSLK